VQEARGGGLAGNRADALEQIRFPRCVSGSERRFAPVMHEGQMDLPSEGWARGHDNCSPRDSGNPRPKERYHKLRSYPNYLRKLERQGKKSARWPMERVRRIVARSVPLRSELRKKRFRSCTISICRCPKSRT
jgi:hypothetical protein